MYVNILQQITSPLFSTFETFNFLSLFITLLLYFFADESTPEKKSIYDMFGFKFNFSFRVGVITGIWKFSGEADDIRNYIM